MNNNDISKIQTYLQKKFSNPNIIVKFSNSGNDMAEVYINNEFIGTLYRDEDDGEVSYDFNMSIIDIDLI